MIPLFAGNLGANHQCNRVSLDEELRNSSRSLFLDERCLYWSAVALRVRHHALSYIHSVLIDNILQ